MRAEAACGGRVDDAIAAQHRLSPLHFEADGASESCPLLARPRELHRQHDHCRVVVKSSSPRQNHSDLSFYPAVLVEHNSIKRWQAGLQHWKVLTRKAKHQPPRKPSCAGNVWCSDDRSSRSATLDCQQAAL